MMLRPTTRALHQSVKKIYIIFKVYFGRSGAQVDDFMLLRLLPISHYFWARAQLKFLGAPAQRPPAQTQRARPIFQARAQKLADPQI